MLRRRRKSIDDAPRRPREDMRESASGRIALYHTRSGFFATENTCPHRGGPLGEGDLIGDEIVCPWHLWGFDVADRRLSGQPESQHRRRTRSKSMAIASS